MKKVLSSLLLVMIIAALLIGQVNASNTANDKTTRGKAKPSLSELYDYMQMWYGCRPDIKTEKMTAKEIEQLLKKVQIEQPSVGRLDTEAIMSNPKLLTPIVASRDYLKIVLYNQKVALPVLLKQFPTAPKKQRNLILSALLRIDNAPEAIPTLLQIRKETKDRDLRMTALYLLNMGGKSAIPEARKLLKTNLYDVEKMSLLFLLARTGSASEAELIRTYLKDPNARVRSSAAYALAIMGDQDVLPELLEMSKDKDYSVKYDAIEALGYLDLSEAKQRLEEMLAQDPESAQIQSSLYNQQLLKASTVSEKLALLSTFARHDNELVSDWAVEKITAIRTSAAKKILENFLLDGTGDSELIYNILCYWKTPYRWR